MELRHLAAVGIQHLGTESKRARHGVFVLHLRFGVNHGLLAGDVEVGGIDVRSRRTQIRKQRQCLIQAVCHVQKHVFRNAAIVGIEVTVVPLVAAVVLSRAVRPAVVAAYGQHVLAVLQVGCQVETTRHNAILAEAQMMAIQVEVCSLAHPLELNEEL